MADMCMCEGGELANAAGSQFSHLSRTKNKHTKNSINDLLIVSYRLCYLSWESGPNWDVVRIHVSPNDILT